MKLTWSSLSETEKLNNTGCGSTYTDEQGLTYSWSGRDKHYCIISYQGEEIARIGKGTVHGMLYLVGTSETATRTHNQILQDNQIAVWTVGVTETGEAAIYYESDFIELLNGHYENNKNNPIVGSAFFQMARGYSVYSHYSRDKGAKRAEYVFMDSDVEIWDWQI